MMIIALALLLVALGFVLYRDRDFWFPDADEAVDQEETIPAAASQSQPAALPSTTSSRLPRTAGPGIHRKSRSSAAQPKTQPKPAEQSDAPPITATTQRTVLPPLEVEVVEGNIHRTLQPGSSSVRVDLQPGSPPQAVAEPPATGNADTAATLTSNAAEHVQMSAETADVVTHSVQPGYPLLARQMKVQGSVILQALIGRDGVIQDLRILSGAPILASAAKDAVRQWHFKPHYQGADPVETQARITVNFTISTN
jgi:TonB family protein